MEEEKQEKESHAKTQRRKENGFAPLRLCVSAVGYAPIVFLFALVVRWGMLSLTPGALQNDPDGYLLLAANLADYRTFGIRDTPTAYRPPLYPIVLSPCVLVGNHYREVVIVFVKLLHLLLGVATVGLVFLLGRWWGLGRGAAAVASLLVACDPILLASSTLVMTETLATFLATAGLLALAWVERQRTATAVAGSQRLPDATSTGSNSSTAVRSRLFLPQMIAGVVLGLASLCRPAFLLWAIAAAVLLWWRSFRERPITDDNRRGPTARSRIAGSFRKPAAFAIGVILVLSPWAIRNQFQFGWPIVTTTHGGYTLYLANNPEFYEWLWSGSWGTVWNADHFNAGWQDRPFVHNPGDELPADRLAYDELLADRLAYFDARWTIREQPGTFFYACLVRIGRFWSPLPHQLTPNETFAHRLSRYAVALWYIAEFALAMLGTWRVSRVFPLSHWALKCPALPSSSWRWGLLLVLCLLAGHVVYWTDMRMRAPIMPVVAIIAAAGLFGCRSRDD